MRMLADTLRVILAVLSDRVNARAPAWTPERHALGSFHQDSGVRMTEPTGALDKRVLEELRASVGGDQPFVAELVDDFLADAPAQLEALRKAAASADASTARRAAHTLKGTSRTFGADALASMCQEAEAAAAAGDVDSVGAHLDGIDDEWARVRTELLSYRDGGA